ncbi:hypothetical protein AB0C76_00505 [Kitasatospora sp. NPDC048722]
MIVSSTTASAAVILGPDGERVRVRCLARRDMRGATRPHLY